MAKPTPKKKKKKEAKKSFYVYILETLNEKLYTGYTNNIERRMNEHQKGRGSKFVRSFGFKQLLYFETHKTQLKAMRREAALKRWPRAKKQALIKCV